MSAACREDFLHQSSHRPYSFANQRKHRPVSLNTSRCYCGKTSLSEKMWQNDQSHETLAKHAPTTMYMTTKWEVINRLITTSGLIVIPHITLHTFIRINAPIRSIYLFSPRWFASCAIFTRRDLSNGQLSKTLSAGFKLKGTTVACVCLFLMLCRNYN